jgi:hypothetical protein
MPSPADDNIGVFDGHVTHAEVNAALGTADKVILFGQQRRQPHFPQDRRLDKLHAGDELVLMFWRCFKLLPPSCRDSFFTHEISITLCRGEGMLFYDGCRRHQSLHVGIRRRTVYLPEILLRRAADLQFWPLVEALCFAAWILADYAMLAAIIKPFRGRGQADVLGMGDAPVLRRLVATDGHRGLSSARAFEVDEFVGAYLLPLGGLEAADLARTDAAQLAWKLFDVGCESAWAWDRVKYLKEVYDFPTDRLFDRDLVHPAAYVIAAQRDEQRLPQTFADVLHDYRDSCRFEVQPLLVKWGRHTLPKPQAVFLRQTVGLGPEGLIGFFAAYSHGNVEARQLVHPMWIYLCRLSSDPAGVHGLFGRCRALGGQGEIADLGQLVAGIFLRLDLSPSYADLVEKTLALGTAAHRALEELVERLELRQEDEWAPFKSRKQGIVDTAATALAKMNAQRPETTSVWGKRKAVHADPLVRQTLEQLPHRCSSDPVGTLVYLKAYERQLAAHGPADAEANALLVGLLVRLDRSEHYAHFLGLIESLGAAAIGALVAAIEQIDPQDPGRRAIYQQARRYLGRSMTRYRRRRQVE